jgi:pyridoxamine 5'-phosphate oxidase
MENEHLQSLRRSYELDKLDKTHIHPDPFQQFKYWLHEAAEDDREVEANAMVLSTVSPEGQPSGRVVLLKGILDEGFVFYTNYNSHKGQHLAHDARCSATFWWQHAQRQVRLEGRAVKIDPSISAEYFQSRPLESQLGAIVSPQSSVVGTRTELDEALQDLQKAVAQGAKPVMPEHWGGYRLLPHQFEFWQGRMGRLHDRMRYRKEADTWIIERLAP